MNIITFLAAFVLVSGVASSKLALWRDLEQESRGLYDGLGVFRRAVPPPASGASTADLVNSLVQGTFNHIRRHGGHAGAGLGPSPINAKGPAPAVLTTGRTATPDSGPPPPAVADKSPAA